MKQNNYPKEIITYIFISPIVWLINEIKKWRIDKDGKRK